MLDVASVALQYVENVRTAASCGGGTSSILNVRRNFVSRSSKEGHFFGYHRRYCLTTRSGRPKLMPQFVCQTYWHIGSRSTEAVPPWPTNYCSPWQEPRSKPRPWLSEAPSPLSRVFIETWTSFAPTVFIQATQPSSLSHTTSASSMITFRRSGIWVAKKNFWTTQISCVITSRYDWGRWTCFRCFVNLSQITRLDL